MSGPAGNNGCKCVQKLKVAMGTSNFFCLLSHEEVSDDKYFAVLLLSKNLMALSFKGFKNTVIVIWSCVHSF